MLQACGILFDGFLEPEMLGALERFAQLYKEGLIDRENQEFVSEMLSFKNITAREE